MQNIAAFTPPVTTPFTAQPGRTRHHASVVRTRVRLPLRRRATVAMVGFGIQRLDTAREESQVPNPDVDCACGSGKSYGRCCRGLHIMARTPRNGEELLRARYSAYAYRLPTFVMRTTAKSEREFDRRKWRKEITEFCDRYRFDGGINILEENMTGPDSCSITFEAKLLEQGAPTSFVEMSKFARDDGIWYYVNGKLVDFYDDAED